MVSGVGINDADYQVTSTVDGVKVKCKFYVQWKSMLDRSYSSNAQKDRPDYIGNSVHKDWHRFRTFKRWMESQDWEGNVLDKDLMYPRNKVYSAKTCLFISNKLNTMLQTCHRKSSSLPTGVILTDKIKNPYRVMINNGYEREHLDLYKTPEKASNVYIKRKLELWLNMVRLSTNRNEIEGLFRHCVVLIRGLT